MKRLTLFALAMLVLMLVLPTLAQDTDPIKVAPTEATVEAVATVEQAPMTIINTEGGVILNQTPTEATDEVPEAPVEPEPWYAKYGAALLGLAGLLTTGVIALNKWLEARKTDAGSMTLLEQAYAWSPAFVKKAVVALIKQLIRLGDNLQEVLDEATDGTPYVVKVSQKSPSPTPPASGPTTIME